MCPRTQDNYGENSCAILCLHSTPPIVCIANCNGTIYHAILLPVSNEKCLMQVLDFDFPFYYCVKCFVMMLL